MSVQKAASAGAWSAVDIVLRQGTAFVVAIVLARLLTPEDFGLVALLTFFSSLAIVFVQGGLTLALVQRVDSTHEEENAIFWSNLIAGSVFALFLIAIAPLVARFYQLPLLDPLMFVAAAQVVISALGAVQTSLLTRTLRFDQLTKTGILSSLLSGAAGIGAALAGWGVWALAVQILVLAAVSTIALWWVSDWRPAWSFRFSSIRSLLGFGVHISLSAILDVLFSSGLSLVIGKLYGIRDLGMWNRAAGITAFPTGIITSIVSRTALPLFSARADDTEGLLRGLRLATNFSMLLSLPMIIGLALLSDLVVVVLVGEKWLPAAPIMTVIVLAGAFMPMHILNIQLLLARGGSRVFLDLEIRKKLMGLVVLGAGCFFGLMGLAYAIVIFATLALVINTKPTQTSLGYGILRQLYDIRGIFLCVAIMAAGVQLLRTWITAGPFVELPILSLFGAALYFAVGFAFRVTAFREAVDLARVVIANRKGRGSPAPALAETGS